MAAIGLAIVLCCFLLYANCENEKQMTLYPPAFQQFLNSFTGDFPPGPAAAPPQPAPPLPSSYMPYPHWINYNMAPVPFAVVPIPPGYTDYKDTVNKLPPFLEWILNRIQNYYSHYQSIPWEPEEPESFSPTTSTSTTSSTMIISNSTENEEISLQENSNSDLNLQEKPIEALQIKQNLSNSEIGMNFNIQNLHEPLLENNSISNEQEIIINLNSTFSSGNFEDLTEEIVNNSTESMNLQTINSTNNKDSLENSISLLNNQTLSSTGENSSNFLQNSEINLSNSSNAAVILGKPEDKLTIGLDTIYSVDEQTSTTIKDSIVNAVYNLTEQEVSTSKIFTTIVPTTTKSPSRRPIQKPIDSDAIYFPSYIHDDEPINVPRPRSL